MIRLRRWAARLHVGQALMLSALLGAACLVAGTSLVRVVPSADTCADYRMFGDSLRANRARLRSTDSVLARFRLAEVVDPLYQLKQRRIASTAEMPFTERTTEDVIREVVAMRLVGVPASDVREYLLHIGLTEGPGVFAPDSAARQVAAIHAAEASTLYVLYVKDVVVKDTSHSRYLWYDTVSLTRRASDVRKRCDSYQARLPIAIAGLGIALVSLFFVWWWWFDARRTPTA